MKILFWNIKNKPETKTEVLTKLIEDTDPDLFFIAESNQAFDLKSVDSNYTKIDFKGSRSKKIVTGFAKTQIQIVYREYYFEGRIAVCVVNNGIDKIAICGVHLWSKLNDSLNQKYFSGKLREEIFKICNAYDKVLFIGDFNLNPWDSEMCSIIGINAIPWSSEININNHIMKGSTKHYYLYNPMWNYLGDEMLGVGCGAKGSYKMENEGDLNWKFIDQVVCSKELIGKVFPNKIKIIEKVNIKNIATDILVKEKVNNKKQHKYSDHYPIYCNIN